MTRGQKPVKTRQDIMNQLDKLAVKKGLDQEDPPKDGKLFQFYMKLPERQRPTRMALAEQYKTTWAQMDKYVTRWDRDERSI